MRKLTANTTNSSTQLPVITIDGASGAGKGTLTSRLAKQLDYEILDSGALYRIVGLMAEQAGLLQANPDADALTELTRSLTIQFLPNEQSEHIGVVVNGTPVGDVIRTEAVGELASKVAVFAGVRDALLQLQRNMASYPFNQKAGLVADGRDMGTVVFPDAALKLYLVASAEARAERRLAQLARNGQTGDFATILAQIVARDERDSSRATAPAKPAEDAIIIDTSVLDADAVFDQVWQLCQQRNFANREIL